MQTHDRQLDITSVIDIALYRRWWILAGLVVGMLAGVTYVLLRTPIYRAEILVQPIKRSSGAGLMQALSGQLGGLASLAGLDVGGSDDTTVAVATLKSHRLVSSYITDMNLLPVLYMKKWDAQTGRWNVSDPDKVPTVWSAERLFSKKIRTITENKSTGLVTMTIDWTNPKVAAQWANDLVARADALLRQEAHTDAKRNIDFIEKQLQSTNLIEVKDTLNRLLEAQWNKLMLSEGETEYALRVVDPAVVPMRDNDIPKAVAILIWTFGGGALVLMVAVIGIVIRPQKENMISAS